MKKIVIFLGTRPEVIKMAPLISALRDLDRFEIVVVKTGQHTELFDKAIAEFGVIVDITFEKRDEILSMPQYAEQLFNHVNNFFNSFQPHLVLVHGDTLTSAIAALSSYLSGFPVGHIEAGLRSRDLNAPFPEEGNRRIIDSISTLHFPPTKEAADNLAAELHSDSIGPLGNTVVDSLHTAINNFGFSFSDDVRMILEQMKSKEYIFVTQHRREIFGAGLTEIFRAFEQLATLGYPIIFPVHPNPNIKDLAFEMLGEISNIFLMPPIGYLETIKLINGAALVITDSGGIQEEASILGKPTIITRLVTERPEVLINGNGVLVGSDSSAIVDKALDILENEEIRTSMSRPNLLFGDGKTSLRITDVIMHFLK